MEGLPTPMASETPGGQQPVHTPRGTDGVLTPMGVELPRWEATESNKTTILCTPTPPPKTSCLYYRECSTPVQKKKEGSHQHISIFFTVFLLTLYSRLLPANGVATL